VNNQEVIPSQPEIENDDSQAAREISETAIKSLSQEVEETRSYEFEKLADLMATINRIYTKTKLDNNSEDALGSERVMLRSGPELTVTKKYANNLECEINSLRPDGKEVRLGIRFNDYRSNQFQIYKAILSESEDFTELPEQEGIVIRVMMDRSNYAGKMTGTLNKSDRSTKLNQEQCMKAISVLSEDLQGIVDEAFEQTGAGNINVPIPESKKQLEDILRF